ncbi:MAG: hypothetical protein Q9181_001964 [Wetmoreana brouardii]
MSSTRPVSQDSRFPDALIKQAEAAAAGNSNTEGSRLRSNGSLSKNGSGSLSSPHQSHEDPLLDHEPPPAFSNRYGEVDVMQDGFGTNARVADDGRVDININQRSHRLSNLLVPALRSQLDLQQAIETTTSAVEKTRPIVGGVPDQAASPPLNVVIHVVGSRGDVQPFVALGKVLKAKYAHRIRLATHPTFRSFVEENGLEFFSIGGDPSELMAFSISPLFPSGGRLLTRSLVVKNPGLMPGMDSLRSGDVGRRRKGMYEIVQGCWRSCIEIGDGTGIVASDDHLDSLPTSERSTERSIDLNETPSAKPFVADAIIANPPSFAHIHCAEKLGIPLHLMFTMPWSPTQAFPHPLANIQSSNADQSITNFMSYALVEMMTWQGLGDIINRFRERSLGLEPVSLMWAPGMANRLRIPYTYCWSPALIPKPRDWGPHISISGFYFLALASQFTPDPELASFLEARPPPVYIGFGSIVVDDPNAMTRLIFEAVQKSGQRALVSKGWGGLGADLLEIPENVFMLGNVPHDWLFQHVSCVVHHGGAGTTAAGIAAGKPTVVVPFFGDQPFWGSMVAKAGAGPWPLPYKQLTADKLAAAILGALQPNALRRAQELGVSIGKESGADVGARDFQDKLDIDSLRCSVAPNRAAAWRVKRTNIRLSAFAATVLGQEGLLDLSNLKLYRPREYDSEDGPWDPVTGATSAIMGTIGSMMMGVADLPIEMLRLLRIKPSDNPGAETASSSTAIQSTTLDSSIGTTRPSSVANSSVEDIALSPPVSQSSLGNPSATHGGQDSRSMSCQSLDEAASDLSNPPLNSSNQQSTESALSWRRGQSMAETLGGSVSRSPSRGRSSLGASTHRSLSESRHEQISLDSAVGAGKGVGRIVGAGLKSPMDFTLSLARGFHNAPKLYGDDSVRNPDKVTGIQSGFKAAGKEFGYGMYDGVSGLFTQPFHGAKQEGVAGFVKGVGKGIGGLLLKPPAAFFSIPAYTMSGIYKELQKHFGSSVQNYIVAARTAQGFDELAASTQQQRLDVVKRWQTTQIELHKEQQRVKDNSSHQSDCVFLRIKNATHSGFEERKAHIKNGKLQKTSRHGAQVPPSRKEGSISTARPDLLTSASELAHADTATFEEAIQQAVQATSRGDPRQDVVIERAIRASVMELREASKNSDKDQAVQRAIQASVAEATRAREAMANTDRESTADQGEELRLALQRSVSSSVLPDSSIHHGFDDSGMDTDYDDGTIKSSLEQSKSAHHHSSQDDLELQKAIEESRLTHENHAKDLERERTEEKIVLEYVKKQSLLEEEHRRTLASRTDAVSGSSTDET